MPLFWPSLFHMAATVQAATLAAVQPLSNWLTSPGSPLAKQMRANIGYELELTMPFIVAAWVLLAYCLYRYRGGRGHRAAKFAHNNKLETTWTVLPVLALLAVMFPAYSLLHRVDYGPKPDLTVNVIGHQFFWEFKYPGYGIDRANQALVVPANRNIALDITSLDVIHGFFVPDLGVQMDAVPGHITYAWFRAKPGTYRGQCAQLCGTLHGEMLITIIALPPAQFQAWLGRHAKAAGSTRLRRPHPFRRESHYRRTA